MENEEVIKQIENTMSPRFGHTITLSNSNRYLVQKSKAVLFGGATGIEGKFAINSDTYVYYVESKQWVKLDRNSNFNELARGSIPSPRAAHASCCVNINQLVIYGGATGGISTLM